jgi:metallo-beta-lactamase family protein
VTTPCLQFLGATGTVTGSKFLVGIGPSMILVDCGLFQGPRDLRERNWSDLGVAPSAIDAVVLTHAHVDHSGALPLLTKQGFSGSIHATSGTAALCRILLPDAAHLQEQDAEFANRKGFTRHRPALPLYDSRDAQRTLEHEVVPLFYQRDNDGLPRNWIAMMKRAIQTLAPMYNSDRMVEDYARKIYPQITQIR